MLSSPLASVSTFIYGEIMPTIIFTFDDEIDCPECGGEGRVEYEFNVIDHIRGGEVVGLVRECRMCEGSGVIYVEPADDEAG
jgi:DnaJ-class molecular chaperone